MTVQPTAPIAADQEAAFRKLDLPKDHPSVKSGKVGVLLVNLGTPDGTDYWPMRRYLREFLSDKRVIEWPRAIWYPILYGIVLMTRPGKSGKAYEEIWNKEKTSRLCARSRAASRTNCPRCWAMRTAS